MTTEGESGQVLVSRRIGAFNTLKILSLNQILDARLDHGHVRLETTRELLHRLDEELLVGECLSLSRQDLVSRLIREA